MYKLRHVKFFYNIASDDTPYLIQNLVTWRESPYNLTGNNKVVVPRFSTNFMEHSRQYLFIYLCLNVAKRNETKDKWFLEFPSTSAFVGSVF